MNDSPNMTIWDSVSTTAPSQTKRVNQRGGFTAIDAHSQFMAATKQFGPIGVGWGFVAGDPIFQETMIIVPVTLWHGERSNTFGPFYGCEEMFGKRFDSDAPKKATTDGITKGLALLGFNADVFLGKFDDQKYVEERKKEEAAKNAPPQPTEEEKQAKRKAAATIIADQIRDADDEVAAAQLIAQKMPTLVALHGGDYPAFQIIKEAADLRGAEIRIPQQGDK
jgi:hypothetical protein